VRPEHFGKVCPEGKGEVVGELSAIDWRHGCLPLSGTADHGTESERLAEPIWLDRSRADRIMPSLRQGRDAPVLRAAAVLIFLLATCTLSGCGTLAACSAGSTRPYGGVARDLDDIRSLSTSMTYTLPPFGPLNEHFNPFAACLVGATAIDMPFSFLADTLCLPYTVPSWLIHGVEHLP
jgi:uncharacterized protein YceK